MANYTVDGSYSVIDFDTGKLVWAGDVVEVAGLFQRVDDLKAQLAEKDSIIDSLQKALNYACEDVVRLERILENRNATVALWKLNYALACERADNAEERAKEAEKDVEQWKSTVDDSNQWATDYYEAAELWQKQAEEWREKAENALKQTEEYEEWYMRADSGFEMAKWRANKAEADVELWRKRAEYAGKKYHELRRLAEVCFDAWRKDTVRMISDWHRYDALEQACDQAISNLRVVVSLAEGSEEEDAIIDIIQTTCGELMQAINGGQRS